MSVLVVNCGSTSVKATVVNPTTGKHLVNLVVERLGTDQANYRIGKDPAKPCPSECSDALAKCLPLLIDQVPEGDPITGVGHRVVHGGVEFTRPTLLDDDVVQSLRRTFALAPLHNPANVNGIESARQLLSDVPHAAVFDTAFHNTISRRAYTYAVPTELAQKHDLRRFGFHGTSHRYVANRAAEFLGDDIRQLRLITCHLGGGCSVCAVEYGRSIETSMGLTPLEGLVMGTRCGDIDPSVLLQLARAEGMDADQLDDLVNRKSGLAGMSGVGSDLRDIESKAEEGDERCRLAIQVFCHRLRKYIGAYAAVMGGVDAIVFTAGIGQNSSVVRHRVGQRLEFLGARLDEERNRSAKVDQSTDVVSISPDHSRVKMLVARTDEAVEIAQQTNKLFQSLAKSPVARTIPVAISARHVHLTQETVEALFGPGHKLTELKPLSQPGQFAANEQVTLVGPKRNIERVRVLGPTRSKNQVEISRTDEFFLGIDAPIRASGKVDNTPGITLIGSDDRRVTIDRGVICAWRHIHMTPEDAAAFGVEDKDVVDVEVGTEGVRSLTFGDVLVRVKSSYKLEMHIDTDEGNAAELSRTDQGVLEEETVRQVKVNANLAKKR